MVLIVLFITVLLTASGSTTPEEDSSPPSSPDCDSDGVTSEQTVDSGQTLPGTVAPLYRYRSYSATGFDHFYTTDPSIVGACKAGKNGRDNYFFQRIECIIATSLSNESALVPLYQYWSPSHTDHWYMTNASEVGAHGHHIVGYCSPTLEPGTVPLYRYWSWGLKDHLYTTDANDAEVLFYRAYTFRYHPEGIACYVYKYHAHRGALY